jgi:phage replication O-like protein O
VDGNPAEPEKGYTKIENELLKALIVCPLTMAELKILLLVIRNTAGWGREKTFLSYGKISKITGLDERHAKRVVEKLCVTRILFKEKHKRKNVFSLNGGYPQWRLWIIQKGVAYKTP